MCKSSAGPGRNNTIWKLSVSALCQPATRYTPTPLFYWKTSPLEPQWLPVSQTAHRWPLQARKLSSSQGAKEPRGLDFFPFFSPPDSKMALLAARSGLGKEGGETRGESSEERERDGEKVLKFAFLIWSPRHFTLLQDLKSPLIPPHIPLDFFLIWQGFPQNSRSPDGRTEATSHAADSHVSWQLTLSQSCDQFDLFVCFN